MNVANKMSVYGEHLKSVQRLALVGCAFSFTMFVVAAIWGKQPSVGPITGAVAVCTMAVVSMIFGWLAICLYPGHVVQSDEPS